MARRSAFSFWLEEHKACSGARQWVGNKPIDVAWDTAPLDHSWHSWLVHKIWPDVFATHEIKTLASIPPETRDWWEYAIASVPPKGFRDYFRPHIAIWARQHGFPIRSRAKRWQGPTP